ncbi:hypothetical protein SZN_25355 [Streptomyces zinciresistens K42]|uniref:Secreted protein n=1 Tax=Streptomyces zinciresistens K42 TaxID=700597 RepID=G2GHT2_9ACTN|nr:hypothetical protein SZN_25355 [Streptomyces zinciresistens K42]
MSVVCALAPWVFTQAAVLRGVAAAAAATTVLGAFVMRRWDSQAGKQVADLTRARASDEWRHEEKVAELDSDLDESRELRVKLEQRLRAKRAELAGLRNEHAALLRRYATAETERASVLEERRVLEIEATTPARALPPGTPSAAAEGAVAAPAGARGAVTAPAVADAEARTETAEDAAETGNEGRTEGGEGAAKGAVEPEDGAEAEAGDADAGEAGDDGRAPAAFSPEGSRLFLRAKAALARFDGDAPQDAEDTGSAAGGDGADSPAAAQGAEGAEGESAENLAGAEGPEGPGGAEGSAVASEAAEPATGEDDAPAEAHGASSPDARRTEPATGRGTEAAEDTKGAGAVPEASGTPAQGGPSAPGNGLPGNEPPRGGGGPRKRPAQTAPGVVGTGRTSASHTPPAVAEDDARGKPEAAGGHERAAAPVAAAQPALPSARRPAGHFIEPTAVAVVPGTPARRPNVEGGFDFFGTKKGAEPSALESVQNEDLADVVGQEALALHKAESEAEFKPADERSRGVGQVIDLTAHDETEQIDVQRLRSAVS